MLFKKAVHASAAGEQLPKSRAALSGAEPELVAWWDRHVEASYDSATHVTYTGLVNFTNGNPGSADSGNCLVNSLLYDESMPLQVRAVAWRQRPPPCSSLACLRSAAPAVCRVLDYQSHLTAYLVQRAGMKLSGKRESLS